MTVVRVVVRRSGGFAGLERTAEVDDPAEAQAIADDVDRTDPAGAGAVRDGFVYSVTVVSHRSERTVELPAAALPGDLRERFRGLVG